MSEHTSYGSRETMFSAAEALIFRAASPKFHANEKMLFGLVVVAFTAAIAAGVDVFPRPGLYFGTTTSIPDGVQTGVAWMSGSRVESLRHHARMEDDLAAWGWDWHDGRGFGSANITDPRSNIRSRLAYVAESRPGSVLSGSWRARWDGTCLRVPDKAPSEPLSLFFYVSVPNGAVELDSAVVDTRTSSKGISGDIVLSGTDAHGESFSWVIRSPLPPATDEDEVDEEREEEQEEMEESAWLSPSLAIHPPAALSPAARRIYALSAKSPARIPGASEPSPPWAQRAHFIGVTLPEERLWNAQEVLAQELRSSLHSAQTLQKSLAQRRKSKRRVPLVPVLPDRADTASNLFIVQLIRPPCDWSVDATFLSHEAATAARGPMTGDGGGGRATNARIRSSLVHASKPLFSLDPADAMQSRLDAWTRRFHRTFAATASSASLSSSTPSSNDQPVAATWRFAVSNLLGSISFHYGRQLVGAPPQSEVAREHPRPVESEPHGLITGCPARAFFPRGFLWDEGFHQSLVAHWDPLRTEQVLNSWLNTMDNDGWIAREQILGPESRSKVPPEFQVQRHDIANPPTLLYALQHWWSSVQDATTVRTWTEARQTESALLASGEQSFRAALRRIWGEDTLPVASTHGHSVEETMVGGILSTETEVEADGSMHGWWRQWQETLPSKLETLYSKLRQHLLWMARSQSGPVEHSFRWRGTEALKPNHTFASGLDDFPRGKVHSPNDQHVDLLSWMTFAAARMQSLAEQLDTPGAREDVAMWRRLAEARRAALDRHWDAEAGFFCDIGVREMPSLHNVRNGQQLRRAIAALPVDRVCHVGYVGLLPLALALLDPADPRIGALLAAVEDPERLGGPAGVRSLSRSDPFFGTGEDYWRGAVWMNLNILTLQGLESYAAQAGPFQERAAAAATRLRGQLVGTVEGAWNATQSIWENYDPESGRGRGAQPFTGWSALVATLAA